MDAARTRDCLPSPRPAQRVMDLGDQCAGRYIPAHLFLWIPAAAVLALDLWSKHWAFATLGTGETRRIIPRVLEFRRSLNAGAVFGSFAGHTELFLAASLFALAFVVYLFARSGPRQHGLHASLALILAGAIGNMYDRTFVIADVVTHRSPGGAEESIIGLITSEPSDPSVRIGDWPDGAHPRSYPKAAVDVRRQGVVRDFIKFVPEFPSWVPRLGGRDVWPWVFNVADAALVCGVGVLLLGAWRKDEGRRSKVDGPESKAGHSTL